MSELRRRQGQSPKDDEGSPSIPPSDKFNSTSAGRKPLVVILAFLFLVAGVLSFTIHHKLNQALGLGLENPRIYSPSELAQYTGVGKDIFPDWWPLRRRGKILLACMGKVFDVTPGYRHYGPGGGYSFFAGKDASRSFVTGDFQNDLTDTIADLSAEDIAAILQWREFYETSKDYKFVGRVVGKFYNDQGDSLPYLIDCETRALEYRAQEAAKEAAEEAKAVENVSLCNVSWKKSQGGWVYCNDDMVPRKVGIPSSSGDGKVEERCVCVEKVGDNKETEGRQVYEGCSESSSRCQTSKPEED